MKALAPVHRSLLSLAALVAFSFAFVYGIGGVSTRVMQSFHGLHHSAYVYQIVQGIIPPTNPSSVDMSANFYWGWHALLAAGVKIFEVTPFEMSLLSNALGLAGFLCGLFLAAGQYTASIGLRLAICGVPFFLLNPLGLGQFAGRLAWVWVPELVRGEGLAGVGLFDHLIGIARHHGSLSMVDHNLSQLFPRLGLFEDVALSDRVGHLANKFLNFSSFPLALAFFAGGQGLLVTQRIRLGYRALGLGIAVFGMALLSPLCAAAFGLSCIVFGSIEGAAVLAAARAADATWSREQIEPIAVPLAASLTGLLFALPLLLPVATAYPGEVWVLTPARGLWAHLVGLGWALVPTALLLSIAFWNRARLPRSARVHAASTTCYGVAALVLAAPVADPNEYKFALLSVFPSSLLLLALLRGSPAEEREPLSASRSPGATSVLAAGGVVSLAIMSLLYVASPWATREPFSFSGTITALRANDEPGIRDLDDAYRWLRESSPAQAHVFDVPVDKDESLLPVIAQRRVIAQLASPFTGGIPHHERLVEANRALLRDLGRCDLETSTAEMLRGLPVSWPAELYALVEKGPGFTACNPTPSADFQPVYANASYAVFRITALSAQ